MAKTFFTLWIDGSAYHSCDRNVLIMLLYRQEILQVLSQRCKRIIPVYDILGFIYVSQTNM